METIKKKMINECTFSEETEYLARKLCEFKGIDPDFETTGLDILAPSGYRYPL